jgi:hypothetical protein
MAILKQHLFLDKIGMGQGSALIVLDPDLLSAEGKEEAERLIHE